MKKKAGRILSLFLCIALTMTMAVGCGDEESDSDKGIKIGVSIWNSSDQLGSQCKKILDQAAAALGDVELEYIDQGHVSEQVVASVEKLVADGCSGIIVCNSADREMSSIIHTCDDAGVYLAQFFRIINEQESPDIYDLAKDSQYYIGAVHEDEQDNGRRLGNILLDRGCRKIGMVGWEQGDSTWLKRWDGYQSVVSEWNTTHINDTAELTEPQYAGTTSEGGEKAAEFLINANPDLDAIVAAGGGGEPLDGTLKAIEKAGKVGKIDVVSTDFRDDLEDRLQNGSITAESGGHYCDPLFALLMVYNAVRGQYSDFAGRFCEILYPYLFVDSPEAYSDYKKFFVDQLPYTDDEIRAMAALRMDELAAKAADVSIEDARNRSGK